MSKPDVPCAGCSTLLWSGTTSLPAGLRMCQPCRRARKNAEPDDARPTTCGYCEAPFVSKRRGNGHWSRACSKSCASRLRFVESPPRFRCRPPTQITQETHDG